MEIDDVVSGSNQKIKGGLFATFALREKFKSENPGGDLSNSDVVTYAPIRSGRLPDEMLDTQVTAENVDTIPEAKHIGADTEDSNCYIEFPGPWGFVNAAVCEELGSALAVNDLINRRKAAAANVVS